ncbi:MAG: hypothetical protein M1308_21760 [Actinobacteria bacterium]|nr:hypothetical protein [Actinomycetota bacterium]
MGIYWKIKKEYAEKRKTYGKPRKLLGNRNKCLFCNTSLRHDNKVKTCRQHRYQSPIFKNKQLDYRIKNRDKIRKKINEYAKKHRGDKQEYDRKYRKLNGKKIDDRIKRWRKEKKKIDPIFKLRFIIQSRINSIYKAIKLKKKNKSKELIGCDYKTLKKHLEKQFLEGMNWDNHGEWHIDHIIPLCRAKTEIELKKLCHYKNLQPLWALDNLKKSKK